MVAGRACGSAAVAAIAALAVTLGGCAPGPRGGPSTSVVPAVPPVAPPSRAAVVYDVVPGRSELRLLVYRGGPLARLGHNHVILSRELRGEVRVPDDGAHVTFTLTFPVATLAIDEPQARADEGADFDSRPTASDVEGTRRNMLGPQVLDAAQFPEIQLVANGASGGPEDWRVRVRAEVRGRAQDVDVPVRVERVGDEIHARGELRLAQSALGITPFSVAFGALQVLDEMTVRYSIVAQRRP